MSIRVKPSIHGAFDYAELEEPGIHPNDVLVLGLKELGYNPIPSQTNYFLLPVENSAQFRQKLLGRGILVRDCASFGLPAHVRIATRKAGENRWLLNAIREIHP